MRPVPQQPLRPRVGSVPAIPISVGRIALFARRRCLPGFLVREVIEMVKRTSGVDFKVEVAPRRLGDPAKIVAASDYIRMKLGWKPQYDDLATIIAHALAWEQKLRLHGMTGGVVG